MAEKTQLPSRAPAMGKQVDWVVDRGKEWHTYLGLLLLTYVANESGVTAEGILQMVKDCADNWLATLAAVGGVGAVIKKGG